MTRAPAPVATSFGLKEGGSASTNTCRISDASFSIQSAASRPTVTHARTPHKVTSSGWKPLTQPVALSEERKCANLTTAKRSRVPSSRAVKDSTNHSASKANLPGKKYRDEENMSQGDQLDGAVMPSPPKKLQTCKDPSDSPSIRKSTIRILGGKKAAPLSTVKSEVETGKNFASVPAKVVPVSTNVISQSTDPSVPLLAQQQRPDSAKNSSVITDAIAAVKNSSVITQAIGTAKNSSVTAQAIGTAKTSSVTAHAIGTAKTSSITTQAIGTAKTSSIFTQAIGTAKNSSVITQPIANETSRVNQLAAAVVTLPRQNLQTDYEKKPAGVPIMPNQVSGLAVTPKLEIGKVQDTSNLMSNPAYARALLIKQQEQLLQQYKLASSQQQQQQQVHIKGPGKILLIIVFLPLYNFLSVVISALFETEEEPPVEPLGTRCQLCKLDVAFRPQGDAGRDANAPPVIAVLACHHAFHSSCIESIYGLAEPTECLACLEPGAVH
ncbi:hypothetical protein HU200_041514 [Digitaria exilis]|uniref:RING-type domain-containing protein n=1 Tax=Digitaria exilis TaxID=1010633 RepID=A0A835EDM3_9POAL|nr:hypothetical protein HU200_041514 [Digitaria exilis]